MSTRISLQWGEHEDVEDINRYAAGGYHPVRLGDMFKSSIATYRVLHKLGRGSSATVWLAQTLPVSGKADAPAPTNRLVALKICVAKADSQHESKIYDRLPPEKERHVISLLDTFSFRGPNGTHDVLVQNILGSFDRLTRDSVQKQAREVCKQIVQGVAFLHTHGVTHGDLHAHNIGVCLPTLEDHSIDDILTHVGQPDISFVLTREPVPQADMLPKYLVPPISLVYYIRETDPSFSEHSLGVEIMDLGSGSIIDEPPRPACTAATVCAPEIVFQQVANKVTISSTFASDIWSLACTLYEVVFDIIIFPFSSSSDHLLAAMTVMCGEIPSEWAAHWVASGEPKYLDERTISKETADTEWKRRLDRHEAEWKDNGSIHEFGALLRTMLQLDPSARPTAVEILQHPWFTGCSDV